MSIVHLIFVLCLQMSSAVRNSMPVMMIDEENVLRSLNLTVSTNPFHKTSSNSFDDIIQTIVHRSERVIIFVEERFSVEDLSSRDKLGTPYYYLHRGLIDKKVKYIPNVLDPFKTLKDQFPPLDYNVFYLSDVADTFNDKIKYYYIFFNDVVFNESRVETLRRHDKIMRTSCLAIRNKSPGSVVAFYTGKTNPVHTGMGNFPYYPPDPLPTSEPEPTDFMIVTKGALFRLSGVYSTAGKFRSVQTAPAVAEQARSRRRMMTRMLYSEFELEFEFSYRPDGWLLDGVSLLEGGEEVGRTAMGVGAPWDWSYYCAEPMVIVNHRDNSVVVISRYQVEPLISNLYDSEYVPEVEEAGHAYGHYFRRDEEESTAAGDADVAESSADTASTGDTSPTTTSSTTTTTGTSTTKKGGRKAGFTNTLNCGPYFNSNILAGLFVVSMLLMILTYGIISLYNCETNGRFDDANQKPLVIVAQL